MWRKVSNYPLVFAFLAARALLGASEGLGPYNEDFYALSQQRAEQAEGTGFSLYAEDNPFLPKQPPITVHTSHLEAPPMHPLEPRMGAEETSSTVSSLTTAAEGESPGAATGDHDAQLQTEVDRRRAALLDALGLLGSGFGTRGMDFDAVSRSEASRAEPTGSSLYAEANPLLQQQLPTRVHVSHLEPPPIMQSLEPEIDEEEGTVSSMTTSSLTPPPEDEEPPSTTEVGYQDAQRPRGEERTRVDLQPARRRGRRQKLRERVQQEQQHSPTPTILAQAGEQEGEKQGKRKKCWWETTAGGCHFGDRCRNVHGACP